MAELKNARLLMRQDTADNWSMNNPILKEGELGFEIVKGDPAATKIKIGDGTTAWNNLGYMYDTSAILDMIPQGEHVYTVNDLSEITKPINGDMAIVTALIAEGKVSRTAYIYDASADNGNGDWTALDGNYNASNVYFDDDFTFTAPIGVITAEQIDAGNGSIERSAKGQSMQTFFSGLFAEIKDPEIKAPDLSLTLNVSTISLEVGDTYTIPTATATLDPGSYSYGTVNAPGDTKTGIVATSITISDDKTNESNSSSGTNTCKYTPISDTTECLVTDTTQYINFNAECAYPSSQLQPINNIKGTTNAQGETYSKIAGAFDNATAKVTISGYRKMFMGPIAKDAELNSDTIRSISKISKQESKSAQEFTAPIGTERLIVAFREDYTSATPTFEYFTMSYESFAGFKKLENTVLVADKRGGSKGQVAYTIYECTSNPLEADTKFKIKLN